MISETAFNRLPKAARVEISNLRRELEATKEANRLMVEGETNVWIDSMDGIPLPPDSRIRFDLPQGQRIVIGSEIASHEAGGIGRLTVYASRRDHRLLFSPASTNTGYLYNLDPRYLVPDPEAPIR